MKEDKVTIRSLALGTVFSGLFAFLTVYFENRHGIIVTANQIAVLPYILLFLSVLLINPVCRLLRFVRTFTVMEILLVFIMCSVSAGISTFGLASQLVPVIGNLFNPHWNTDQAAWDVYVEPHVSDGYFLAEPGTRQAAQRLLAADTPWREAQRVSRAAKSLESASEEVALVRRKLSKIQNITDEETRAETKRLLRRRHALALNSLKKTKEWWARYGGRYDFQEVLDTYPAKIKVLEERTKQRRAELDEIEAAAFEKVTVFRRGLPEEMRAIPGIVYVPGEGLASYLDRARRLVHGTSALAELRKADDLLGGAMRSGTNVDSEAAAHIRNAIDKLTPVSQTADLVAAKKQLDQQIEAARERRHQEQRALVLLHRRRRYIHADEADALEREIKAMDSLITGLDGDIKSLEAELDTIVVSRLGVTRRARETRLALENILARLERGAGQPYLRVQGRLWDLMDRFRSFDASLPRFLAGDVPWSQWLAPIARWALIIGLSYVVFMTFNVLIFRQWAHHERLIYPLAQLPQLLAGADAPGKAGFLPPIFKTGLFWAGFGFAGVIMGYNLLCTAKMIPGMSAITLDIWWAPYVQNSAFAPLGATKFSIFFTMIGLAFLTPVRISFSLWFFRVLFMAQLLLICWAGYGVGEGPAFWWVTLNFRTAEAGGGLMVFAAVVLFKCRRYILCFFIPASLRDLGAAERTELRISSFLFAFGSVGLIVLLWRGLGANLAYTVLAYFVFLAISIALTRAVTEGGILGFQAYFSPFHLIRTIFGMNKSWTAPHLYAPLLIYYTILFQEIKTLILPAMANSMKIASDMKMGRIRFHLSIVLAIVTAATVAIGAHVILAYSKGADTMHTWFHGAVPYNLFGTIANLAKTQPVSMPACAGWLLFGAILMAALLFFRGRIFWLPHPIGMIMLLNPLMGTYWFSIFLAWAAKSMITKYGNKETYKSARNFFIGLIAGELFIVVMSMLLAYATGLATGIDLNRQ